MRDWVAGCLVHSFERDATEFGVICVRDREINIFVSPELIPNVFL